MPLNCWSTVVELVVMMVNGRFYDDSIFITVALPITVQKTLQKRNFDDDNENPKNTVRKRKLCHKHNDDKIGKTGEKSVSDVEPFQHELIDLLPT